jgi:hypothetical protein
MFHLFSFIFLSLLSFFAKTKGRKQMLIGEYDLEEEGRVWFAAFL